MLNYSGKIVLKICQELKEGLPTQKDVKDY